MSYKRFRGGFTSVSSPSWPPSKDGRVTREPGPEAGLMAVSRWVRALSTAKIRGCLEGLASKDDFQGCLSFILLFCLIYLAVPGLSCGTLPL